MKDRLRNILMFALFIAGCQLSPSQNVVLAKPHLPLLPPGGPKPDVAACPLFQLSRNGDKKGPIRLNFKHPRLADNGDLTKETTVESANPDNVQVVVDEKVTQPYATEDLDVGTNHWTFYMNGLEQQANAGCFKK